MSMAVGAFAALAAQAVSDVFAHLGDAAELRRGGLFWPVQVVLREPREGISFGGPRDLVRPARTAELPAAQARPQSGDTLWMPSVHAPGGQSWRVAAAPKLSADGQVWVVELTGADVSAAPPAGLPAPPPAPAAVDGLQVEEEEAETRRAAETVSALQVLRALPDRRVAPAEPADAATLLGLAATAAAPGALVLVRTGGLIEDSSWAWTPGLPLFVGAGGALTHTPPASGALRQVALAQSSTVILLGFGPLILRP